MSIEELCALPVKEIADKDCILFLWATFPQLTAEWETRLTGIAKGSDSPADFMRGIEEMTAGLVKTYSAISEDKAKLFTPQREACLLYTSFRIHPL